MGGFKSQEDFIKEGNRRKYLSSIVSKSLVFFVVARPRPEEYNKGTVRLKLNILQ